jgi:ABC-type microcin C transport system permease subunit YejE
LNHSVLDLYQVRERYWSVTCYHVPLLVYRDFIVLVANSRPAILNYVARFYIYVTSTYYKN